MAKLGLLLLVCFGHALLTETCPEGSIPISGHCWVFGIMAEVPFDVAKALCEYDGGLVTVESDPVEIGQYMAKHYPGKNFWAGKTAKDSCLSFSGSKRSYIQEDCQSMRYYTCHLNHTAESPHEGFRHHMGEAAKEAWKNIKGIFTSVKEKDEDGEGFRHNIKEAFSKGWKNIKDLFTYDEEKLENEIVVEGCKPMLYNGVMHKGCTSRGSSSGKLWCSTDGGIFWPGISNWKYC